MNTKFGYGVAKAFSIAVLAFFVGSVFLVYTNAVGRLFVLGAVLTLASSLAIRYAAVYHDFTTVFFKAIALLVTGVATLASGVYTLFMLASDGTLSELPAVFRTTLTTYRTAPFAVDGWYPALLAVATILLLSGVIAERDFRPYPKPSGIRDVAISPVYFGAATTFFGLWAVLLVGIGIQRVIIIAPLFEELLKLGVALLIGSCLFGRSTVGRIGAAIIVGASFGAVEHVTSYPAEPDVAYFFRTTFHMVTTTLSVSTYSAFESRGAQRLLWIAPAISIAVHFFYNTFAVLSGVASVILFGSQSTTVTMIYGGVAILVVGGVLFLSLVRRDLIVRLHRPFEHVLSDVV